MYCFDIIIDIYIMGYYIEYDTFDLDIAWWQDIQWHAYPISYYVIEPNRLDTTVWRDAFIFDLLVKVI